MSQGAINRLGEVNELELKTKIRLFLVAAAACSAVFYYFMTRINSGYVDVIEGRVFIFVLSSCLLAFSYLPRLPKNYYYSSFLAMGFCYICLYGYFLELNQWSIFHRWSYFVVGAIFCGTAMRWKDYLFMAIFSITLPLVMGFWSHLPMIELIHFHAANLTAFAVIGLSVHSQFYYKNETIRLSTDMMQMAKMLALGEMSKGISHEVNNPLHVINSSIHILTRNFRLGQLDNDRFNREIQRILKMTKRLENIAHGLSVFANSDVHEDISNFTVNEVLEPLRELMREQATISGFQFEIETEIREEILFGQQGQLVRGLWCLLDNSIHAIRHQTQGNIKLKIHREHGQVHFDVYDSGNGVPKEIVDRIMEPFFTTREVGEGTGLGLSTSLGIARSHQGDLSYHHLENGSFYFRFSIGEKDPQQGATASQTSRSSA